MSSTASEVFPYDRLERPYTFSDNLGGRDDADHFMETTLLANTVKPRFTDPGA